MAFETTAAEVATALELLAETVNAVDGVDDEQTGVWFWDYGKSAIQLRVDYRIAALDRWKVVNRLGVKPRGLSVDSRSNRVSRQV